MIRSQLEKLLRTAANQALGLAENESNMPAIDIAEPKQDGNGDFTCNFAMVAAKQAGIAPRDLAQKIVSALPENPIIERVEIAGPGFINIFLSPEALANLVGEILSSLTSPFGLIRAGIEPLKLKVNVEFVSVNPNGPITVGSGRGAAVGSALCNVLEAAGADVHREYYINDGVNSEQMRQFALSVQSFCEGLPFPEKGYKGDYVSEVADQVRARGDFQGQSVDWYQQVAQELMLARQKTDLGAFGVEFDTWFSEQSLHDKGMVDVAIEALVAKGLADSRPIRTTLKLAKGGVIDEVNLQPQAEAVNDEGETESTSAGAETLWLRSTKLGDDMDRVLRRGDGRLTYIASDVAYHQDKFNRPAGCDKLITVLGPDHHGYIGRLRAVVGAINMVPHQAASGSELSEIEALMYGSAAERDACQEALAQAKEKLEVLIFQIVRFLKDGKPAPMRKRDGNIYALRDLIAEIGKTAAPSASDDEQMRIGKDVARFFYLMRSIDTHLDFDIDLATKQSDDNPVFYCQYAHARICSVIRRAKDELGLEPGVQGTDFSLLTHPQEGALIKKLCDLGWEVKRSASDNGLHRLTAYAIDLARLYHHFYDQCRVIDAQNPELSRARLNLCHAVRGGLQAVFRLIGISAPERMERDPASMTGQADS